MVELIKADGNGLVTLIHDKGEMPVPFERDIFLFETHIAGTTHVVGIKELEPSLVIGDRLEFIREPENVADRHAIAVRTKNGVKIGFVPRADNAVFARLMDAGKLLFGTLESKEWRGDWLEIRIKVFLRD